MTEIERDAALIDGLGGPTAVSDMLGYPRISGPTKVSQWKKRGIPAAVKVKRPELFMRREIAESEKVA